jgi:hypothetical protein
MSVSVEYIGRFGNWMFQYACARRFAQQNGLKLETDIPDCPILSATAHPEGRSIAGRPQVITDDDAGLFSRSYPPARYALRGFFQRPEWYEDKAEIRKFFALKDEHRLEKNSADIVINLRLEEYKRLHCVIHPEWYLTILKRESFRKLYITGTYNLSQAFDRKYLGLFSPYSPILVPPDPVRNFYFLMSFDKIICSNSTFCWWAAWFGEASRIYMFRDWTGNGLPYASPSNLQHAIQLPGTLMAGVTTTPISFGALLLWDRLRNLAT